MPIQMNPFSSTSQWMTSLDATSTSTLSNAFTPSVMIMAFSLAIVSSWSRMAVTCRAVLSDSRVLIYLNISYFNSYTLERTLTSQHQEQFFLKPFQIENQIANTFDIDCQVTACSKRDNFDGYCVPGDACKDRYATITSSLSTTTSTLTTPSTSTTASTTASTTTGNFLVIEGRFITSRTWFVAH